LIINGRTIAFVVVDSHYQKKHAGSVNDEIVLALVRQLNRRTFVPAERSPSGFQFFVNDRMEHEGRLYKLIWLLHSAEEFVGVVNVYRR